MALQIENTTKAFDLGRALEVVQNEEDMLSMIWFYFVKMDPDYCEREFNRKRNKPKIKFKEPITVWLHTDGYLLDTYMAYQVIAKFDINLNRIGKDECQDGLFKLYEWKRRVIKAHQTRYTRDHLNQLRKDSDIDQLFDYLVKRMVDGLTKNVIAYSEMVCQNNIHIRAEPKEFDSSYLRNRFDPRHFTPDQLIQFIRNMYGRPKGRDTFELLSEYLTKDADSILDPLFKNNLLTVKVASSFWWPFVSYVKETGQFEDAYEQLTNYVKENEFNEAFEKWKVSSD